MKTITTAILVITLMGNCLGQETEKFAKKIADNMCACLGKVDRYEKLKTKLDSCYDQQINQAAIHASSEEIKIIGNIDEFNQVKRSISKRIKTDCPVVRQLVEAEAGSAASGNSYPTNFDLKDYKKAKKNLAEWDGKIVAFDGEILQVNYLSPDKPYLKVKIKGGPILWIGSMVNSQYDKVGNIIRFLGYFSLTSKDDVSLQYHDSGFHILAFGEVDQKSKQIAFMPGSESQIKEWGKGHIPAVR